MSESAVEVRPVVDDARMTWERIAETSDDAWLSHSWDWNTRVEEGVRLGARRSLVVQYQGRVIGIFPLHLHVERRGPIARRILYSNHWSGGGLALANEVEPCVRDEATRLVFEASDAQARRDHADKLVLSLPTLPRSNLSHRRPATAYPGFIDRSSTALVIPVAGRAPEAIWASMEGRARTKVRKAERAGVTVTVATGADALASFYPLHLATYRRTGAAPQPRQLFEVLFDTPYTRTFFAEHEGRRVATVVVAAYAGRAQFFASASEEAALHLGANNLLQWRALQWVHDMNFEAYEVGHVENPVGARDPKLQSIARFLRSFGGDEVPSFAGERVYRRTREAAYLMLREALSRAATHWAS
ncbi:MAG TPA: GNAT family N-acetyltransferase [Candidatus Acidoferrales bacterium]|nr:GNAT family N-acetyltransferase [Candidatus Acidoferrales bacterium]